MTHSLANTLSELMAVYQSLNRDSIDQIEKVYAPNVVFIDPFHRLDGIDALRRYFEHLYHNVRYCQFDFATPMTGADQRSAYVPWRMHYAHPRLRGGADIAVEGVSFIQVDPEQGHTIVWHRDYLDGGQLLYEQLPLVGSLIRRIKRHVSG